LIISILWYRVTKGGSFWVSHWEERMRNIEEQTFGNSINIYRHHPGATTNRADKSEFKKKGYVSTRKTLILVALLMILLWLLLLSYLIIRIIMVH
jgi:hypothetical protein